VQAVKLDSDISVPPEWAPQKAIWTAWPADPASWRDDLASPRRDVAAMVLALARTNRVRLLVNCEEAESSAREAVGDTADIVTARYGDIWLRDIGPIFARRRHEAVALRFKTNGWGGKFALPEDANTARDIAKLAGATLKKHDFVLEGGAIDHDGEGTVLATRQTLLNANRNGWSERQAEAALAEAFGARKIIWIDEGLKNDHTDGHIDNVARFVAPGRVVCQSPAGPDDPNAAVLEAVARLLERATDADGREIDVIRIPGVGLLRALGGELAPASHLNFVIANGVVVVPVYGTASQEAALEALQAIFPGRKVVGIPSHGLLGSGDAGGGSFHCITQQEPA
jgi:agmatine deiminase